MAYEIPDLTKIKFDDKLVETFAGLMVSYIKTSALSIECFKSALDNDPFMAVCDSANLKLAAARNRTAKCYLELVLDLVQNGPDKTWAFIGATLRKDLEERIQYAICHPPRSSNRESDDMATYDLRSLGEVLDRVTKGRF
uniref:Uncharacterized protein n=1 Tax=Caulobacter phage BL57 TaxID=3348355 RepID=A0AB74UH59_9VIRU